MFFFQIRSIVRGLAVENYDIFMDFYNSVLSWLLCTSSSVPKDILQVFLCERELKILFTFYY